MEHQNYQYANRVSLYYVKEFIGCVFACVGFVLLQPSLPLSYLYMYMQCINSYEQYVSIAILLIAISNAYEQYQLQSMRIGLIHHARRRQQHTQNQKQQNRIQGMLFRGLR